MNRTLSLGQLFLLGLIVLALTGCNGSVRSLYQAHRGDILYEKGAYEEALVKFQDAAKLDNPYACYRLYVMYQYGQGVAKDRTEATRMLEKAAMLGDETSQVILGSRLLFGKKADRTKGVQLLEAAAAAENRYAYEYLALAYQHGLGVTRDSDRATQYQRLAKAQGSQVGQLGSSKRTSRAESSKMELTRDIQRALKEQGYYRGKIDGLYGPMTKDAIARFQKDHGYPVNPVVSVQVRDQVTR